MVTGWTAAGHAQSTDLPATTAPDTAITTPGDQGAGADVATTSGTPAAQSETATPATAEPERPAPRSSSPASAHRSPRRSA
jgi:hypothetical protein